jgi:hypothetical protein
VDHLRDAVHDLRARDDMGAGFHQVGDRAPVAGALDHEVAAGDGAVDLTEFAAQLATALAGRPDFKLPLVARLTGAGAGAAGAIVQQAYGPIQLEPQIDAALDLVEALSAGQEP